VLEYWVRGGWIPFFFFFLFLFLGAVRGSRTIMLALYLREGLTLRTSPAWGDGSWLSFASAGVRILELTKWWQARRWR